MNKAQRKLHRKKINPGVKKAKKDLNKKVASFSLLPDKCDVCGNAFDKKSKEHATTWNVTVWNETQKVRLFCPECWETTMEALKLKEKDEEKQGTN